NAEERIHADDISQKDIGNDKRNRQENSMFKQFFPSFGIRIRAFIQLSLLCPVTLDQVFNTPKDQFHKYCLRTGPPAPYSSKYRRKQDNTDHDNQRTKHEDMQILRVKYITKY